MLAFRRNNVRILGHGARTIVFVHGYGCDQRIWSEVAPAFAVDHRVVLLDHMGACSTDSAYYSPARYGTLHGYAADVLEVVRALALPRVVYVGHSVGATVGLLAANSHPEYFERLVMLAPSPCHVDDGDYRGGFERDAMLTMLDEMDADFESWAARIAPLIMGNPGRPELAELLRTSFLRADRDAARHFARVTFLADHRADMARITVPSLLLQCRDDPIAPPSVGEWMAARMPGSRLQPMAATGHCPHVGAPAETIEAIRSALR